MMKKDTTGSKLEKNNISSKNGELPFKLNIESGPIYLSEIKEENSPHPYWLCKREGCDGVLTLLGKVKEHIMDIEEARKRAKKCRLLFPETVEHGSMLSCSKCGDRPFVKGRYGTWQKICILCGLPFAMNGFWRKHGGLNNRNTINDLVQRSPSHKRCMRTLDVSLVEHEEGLRNESKWMKLGHRCVFDIEHYPITNAALEKITGKEVTGPVKKRTKKKKPTKTTFVKALPLSRQILDESASDDSELNTEEQDYFPDSDNLFLSELMQEVNVITKKDSAARMKRIKRTVGMETPPRGRARSTSTDSAGSKRLFVDIEDVNSPSATPSNSPIKMRDFFDSSRIESPSKRRCVYDSIAIAPSSPKKVPHKNDMTLLFDPIKAEDTYFNNVFGDYAHFDEIAQQKRLGRCQDTTTTGADTESGATHSAANFSRAVDLSLDLQS